MTIYEYIKTLSVKDMATFFATNIERNCYECSLECAVCDDSPTDSCCVNGHIKWLESEVQEYDR